MANSPLSTESILRHMADAIPAHTKGDTGSDFSSSCEAIALFAHACMTAVGFRLLGYGEGQKNGMSSLHALHSLTNKQNYRSREPKAGTEAVRKMECLH